MHMKTVLYLAMSLNGKIARLDGAVDWLESIPNPENLDYGYKDFLETIDVTIQGNKTYQQFLSWGIEFPYKNKINYVFTLNESAKDNDDVKFIKHDHVQFVKELKQKEGRGIWIIGGSQVNTLLLNNNLIDELRLFLMPIILPSGIELFSQFPNETSLKLMKERKYSTGVVELQYKIQINAA
jgi:dihydrofolate reductase